MKHLSAIRRTLLLILALAPIIEVVAEQPTVRARFSRDSIEVGDRVEYIIDIELDRATNIGIPDFSRRTEGKESKQAMSKREAYNESLFDLIKDYPIDTVAEDGRRLHLRKRYLLAAMETGVIPMRPAILYFEKNREEADTLYSDDTLRLTVASYLELDTTLFLKADPTSQQGFGVDTERAMAMLKEEGVHTQKHLKFLFAEIRDYAIYGAIALIIIALVAWLVARYLVAYLAQRRTIVKPEPKLPPHIIAIKALEELSHRKLWLNGKHKHYYTALASILKVYIDDRWGIGALDKTTGEVIAALRDVDMPRESRSDLIVILQMADLVKFAKAMPEAEENEANYTRAYYFVENTKPPHEHNDDKRDITIETKINE